MNKETVSIKVVTPHGLRAEISIADLEALGFTRTAVKPWKPVDGKDYHYLEGSGTNYNVTWHDGVFDIARWNMGNCYKTESEAIKARDKQLATVRVLRRLCELEGDWVADWSDNNQQKYHPCYNYSSCLMEVVRNYLNISAPPVWYSTYEAWEQVIKELEQDVKRMMGVV